MENIVTLVTELGSFGLLLGLAGFIIYSYIKNQPAVKNANNDDIKELKQLMKDNTDDIKKSIDVVNKRVDTLEINVSTNINAVNARLQMLETGGKPSHPKQFLDRLKLGPQMHKTQHI